MGARLLSRPRRGHSRFPWLVILAFLAALLLGAIPERAQAQTPTIGKTLCQGTNCGLQSAVPGVAVYYKLSLDNPSSVAAPVTILDALPAGFQLVGYGCAPSAGPLTPLTASTAQPLVISTTVPGLSSVPGSGHLECVIAGTFTGSATGTNNVAQIVDPANQLNVLRTSNTVATNVNLSAPLPSNLSVTKIANVTSVDITSLAQTITYTITITNNGLDDLYLGRLMTLEDSLSLPPLGVVVNATYIGTGTNCALVPPLGGSDCMVPVVTPPSTPVAVASSVPMPFIRWGYPTSGPGSAGLLRAGHKIALTLVIRVSRVPGVTCIIAPNSDGIRNHAHIVLTLPATTPGGPITTLSDGNAPDNTTDVLVGVQTGASQVDPACNVPYQPPSPVLAVTKVQVLPPPSSVLPWTLPGVVYQVTVRNISTTPGLRIRQIRFEDWVVEGLETPPFTARRLAHNCSAPCLLNPIPGPVNHQLLGNGDTRMLSRAVLVNQITSGLAFNQTATFTITVRYSNPGCDSYPAINPKTIFNIGRVTGWTEQVGTVSTVMNQTVQGAAATRMSPVAPCPLIARKTTTSTRIPFSIPPNPPSTTYNVVYRNPVTIPNQNYTMGMVGDMMRIVPPLTGVQPYAVQLRVDYSYSCATTQGVVTGMPAANPNGPGLDTAQVVVTQLPQQGVRLIRNLVPVVFGPNSRVDCNIRVWVHPPAPTDPHCSFGELENAAVLDASIFYDPNMQWPTSTTPGMHQSVRGTLPRCHNLVVNKDAAPPWIWQGGGPLTWTLHVTNAGPPVTAADGLRVTDTLGTGAPAATSSTTCIPSTSNPTAPCTYNWAPAPTAGNPSVLNIGALMTNAEIRTQLTATAPASIGPGGEVCNVAIASVFQPTPPADSYYWKNTPTPARACIPVFASGSLTVVKILTNSVGAQLPANYTFPIGVNCVSFGPNVSIGLAPGGTWTAQHVRAGSTCTISEGRLPVLAPTPVCAHPIWTTTYSPGATVVIPQANNSSTTVTVRNAITCAPVGTLIIRKVTISGPVPPNFTAALFNVSCSPSGPVTVASVAANGQAAVGNIPAPATCTIVEQALPPQAGCPWVGTQVPSGGVAVTAGATTTVTITNRLVCPTATGRLVINKQTIFPPGVPRNLGVSFDLNCNPGGERGISGPPNGPLADANMPAPATCTLAEAPMTAPPGCTWTPTPPLPGSVTMVPGGTVTINVTNRLVCNGPGTLQIRKLTNFPPGVPQFASVQLNVSCTPGGTNTTVTVPANGNVVIPNIAAPSTCAVTEQAPPAPAGCTWTPGIFTPGGFSNGAIPINTGVTTVVLLNNNLVCPPAPGRILIRKTTIVPPGMPVPASVPFNLSCAFGTLTMTVPVPANGQNTSGGIPAGNSCSVTEQLPPAPAGCSWTATRVPAGNIVVTAGATVTVNATNRLTCNGPGSLRIEKGTMFRPGMPPEFALVQFNVACTPGGPVTTVNVPANGSATVSNIPAPSTCTVTEQFPPSSVPGCPWDSPQPGALAIAPGAVTVATFVNRMTCGQAGDATLVVRKFVLFNGSTVPRHPSMLPAAWLPATFPFTVTCGATLPMPGSLNAGNNYQAAMAIPTNTTCTVQESPPAFPSPNCTWSASYPQGQSVLIAGGTTVRDIHNEQVCN